ncbi:MAG: DUF433 domain-containing protein, partial [Xanthobacteraceae bacterium]
PYELEALWARRMSHRRRIVLKCGDAKRIEMAPLDWSQCPAVESIPGKVSGAWVFRGTRLPVATIIENLEDLSVEEVMEQFDVTHEQITAVLDFVARSLKESTPSDQSLPVDAHSL